ncbi:MAG: ADP-dependent NAD(P)H-hydrate dehydratase / NAD(P)H-hydrate epimerase [Acidobacteriota bacterium]|jgi:NAD(P)H-hydrate epimerase|nr:ADP-dependent NAD(P)H-hydrate dehydratase / NAD(P)H-hydrate epimerase [Acidobacteriota bacterium]
MRILTAEAMREVDRAAIEELGIPSLVLMENAAIGVVEALCQAYGEADSVAIFCGPGNNGGDGLAAARHLAIRGFEVRIFLVAGGRPVTGDAGVQLGICRRAELPILEIDSREVLPSALEATAECDVVVDALFGTGLARPLEGLFAETVQAINELGLPVVAVDLPSGLSASLTRPIGVCIDADLTVTFAAPKVAHVFPPASDCVGEMVVTDLGIPPRLVEDLEEEGGDLHLLMGEELAGLLPEREPDSHKGDYGHALILAGSPGKAGAAILAARAAVRAGAGLVTVAVPESILQTVDLGSIESMTLGLPAAVLPGQSGQIAERAAEIVLDAAEGKAVLALGPGLGQDPATVAAIRRIALECPLPLVLDADGLNAFAGKAGDLCGRRAETILTPHPGELGRLLGCSTAQIQEDRVAAARGAAEETGAIVVLKGHLTLVASGTAVFVNPTGNPGMATGGSGDVLTGLLAGLLAQGLDALDATLLAVYLHGLAGDLAAGRLRAGNLAADDLIRILPGAFRMLMGEMDEEPSSPRPSSPGPSHPHHREKRERFV